MRALSKRQDVLKLVAFLESVIGDERGTAGVEGTGNVDTGDGRIAEGRSAGVAVAELKARFIDRFGADDQVSVICA